MEDEHHVGIVDVIIFDVARWQRSRIRLIYRLSGLSLAKGIEHWRRHRGSGLRSGCRRSYRSHAGWRCLQAARRGFAVQRRRFRGRQATASASQRGCAWHAGLESGRISGILLNDHRGVPQFVAIRLIHDIGKGSFHDVRTRRRASAVRIEGRSKYRSRSHPSNDKRRDHSRISSIAANPGPVSNRYQ